MSEDEVTVTNGIRMYRIERLAPLKIDAFLDRTRGRDIFDTSFLVTHDPDAIPDAQVVAVGARIGDLGVDGLLELMTDDEILQAHDLNRVTIDLVEAVRRLRERRRTAGVARREDKGCDTHGPRGARHPPAHQEKGLWPGGQAPGQRP
ncbi:MAG: nucleotidyl transferase AbiEii/AbiGii toxin family protein [Thermomicrobiales bacterium]